MLARIFLRDIVLARNKYLIVTSDAFLLQNNAFKQIGLLHGMYCNCYGPCVNILNLQNPP